MMNICEAERFRLGKWREMKKLAYHLGKAAELTQAFRLAGEITQCLTAIEDTLQPECAWQDFLAVKNCADDCPCRIPLRCVSDLTASLPRIRHRSRYHGVSIPSVRKGNCG